MDIATPPTVVGITGIGAHLLGRRVSSERVQDRIARPRSEPAMGALPRFG